jgi:N-acetylglucosaminyldiphosphoundecaprenol N-acetyl-beta-D-mannosaminyltransferase
MTIPSTKILGVRVDLVSLNQSLSIIDNFISSRKTHQIVVVNVAKIVKSIKDVFLKQIIDEADLSGADGMPLVWVSKLFGKPIPGRVNGTDLMENLIERSVNKGYRIFFLGAEQEVVKKVVHIYQSKFPKLQIAGYRNGYFSPQEESSIANEIGKSKADILFVAFGTPKKEIFIKKYKDIMNVPVIHGVGGSFDVITGKTKRAPLWMQKSGLEWFFRIIQEPKRMWKRYLVTNTLFIWYLLLKLLHLKKFE